MHLRDVIDQTDLRTVTHHISFLERCVRAYHLKGEGDTVVFNSRASDRYRLVTILAGRPMLVLPETELDRRISRYLRVSIQLAGLAMDRQRHFFSERIDLAKARLDRAARRAKAKAALAARKAAK